MKTLLVQLVGLCLIVVRVQAADITVLQNGDVADANVINDNFEVHSDRLIAIDGRIDGLENAQTGQGCTYTDLTSGIWLTTYGSGSDYRFVFIRFDTDTTLAFDFIGRSGGQAIEGAGSGSYSFDTNFCSLFVEGEVPQFQENLQGQLYLSQTKSQMQGVVCSSLTGCYGGAVVKLREGAGVGKEFRQAISSFEPLASQ